ncbi:MAG: HD domain-containing protein [Alphaproteobacteria bacterium]|nr:HD domain-containing protein [Alphaproteobacteria bacterium]
MSWPDSFDFSTDTLCQSVFKPFIEEEMEKLRVYDGQREKGSIYIFHLHAGRVAQDARQLCLALGLGPRVAENMYWAMLPHDIGKRLLPPELWDQEEKPDAALKKFRRTHVLLGAQIVDELLADYQHPFKDLMRDIILHHHEQMDGGGPMGLRGDQLSLPVRLAAIVEAYDGYRTWRPHFGDRDLSPAGVLQRMQTEKAAHYDAALLSAFAAIKK